MYYDCILVFVYMVQIIFWGFATILGDFVIIFQMLLELPRFCFVFLCGVERGSGVEGRVQFCFARNSGEFGVFGWFALAVAQVQTKNNRKQQKKGADGEHRDG